MFHDCTMLHRKQHKLYVYTRMILHDTTHQYIHNIGLIAPVHTIAKTSIQSDF